MTPVRTHCSPSEKLRTTISHSRLWMCLTRSCTHGTSGGKGGVNCLPLLTCFNQQSTERVISHLVSAICVEPHQGTSDMRLRE